MKLKEYCDRLEKRYEVSKKKEYSSRILNIVPKTLSIIIMILIIITEICYTISPILKNVNMEALNISSTSINLESVISEFIIPITNVTKSLSPILIITLACWIFTKRMVNSRNKKLLIATTNLNFFKELKGIKKSINTALKNVEYLDEKTRYQHKEAKADCMKSQEKYVTNVIILLKDYKEEKQRKADISKKRANEMDNRKISIPKSFWRKFDDINLSKKTEITAGTLIKLLNDGC